MSKQNLLIFAAVAVLAVIGVVLYGRLRPAKPALEKQPEKQQEAGQQTSAADNQPKAQTQTSASQTKPGECARDFDSSKLKTAQVDIANKFAELDVRNFGQIRVEFYSKDALKTVENFLRLANAGYYDCLTFHRVAKGFVIQGGDPTGTGAGGESAFGGEFADELNPEAPSYKAGYTKGVLAMANRGPNTNTSQFFIMLGDVQLPHNYTIFGKVTAGLDVVDKIGQVDITPQLGPTDGAPKTPVVMTKVSINQINY